MGTEDECREVAGRLAAIVDVLEVSDPRANHGSSQLVRLYVEIRLDAPPPTMHVTSTTGPARSRRRALPPGGSTAARPRSTR
jgi:hypothetical protein